MEHLTGLQWSAGLFGLAIGMVIGAVLVWFMREHERRADDSTREVLADLSQFVRDAPLGDVPATPEPLERYGNPLVIRMYERWLEADGRGDQIAMRRQEIRMLANGIDPPTSRGDAEGYLAAVKGDLL